MSIRPNIPLNSSFRNSPLIPWISTSIGIVLSLILWHQISKSHKNVLDDIVKQETEFVQRVLGDNVRTSIFALSRMAERWQQQKKTPNEVWQTDAKNYVSDISALTTVEWVDNDYRVRWIEPLAGNEKAVGLDILFNAERKAALEGAERKKLITLTPPLDLVQGYRAFIAYIPIHFDEKFDGFIVGIYNLDVLIQELFPTSTINNFAISITDTNKSVFQSHTASNEDISQVVHLSLFNREWNIQIAPRDALLDQRTSKLAEIIAIFGFIVSFLIGLALHYANKASIHSQHLERKTELLIKREKELERSNQDLDQFANIASHDLKSPLRAIKNYASWIVEDSGDSLSGPSQEHLEKLQLKIDQMQNLLDDILTYSQLGRHEEEAVQVNTRNIIKNIVEMLDVPEDFIIDIDHHIPQIVSPQVPLELVFRNLISNAMKHHDKAKAKIYITGKAGKIWTEFTVKDDGPGISPQYHQKIFEMFQSLKTNKGTGMGLTFAKKLIEQRGGTIEVDSKEGEGTLFRFTWPTTSKMN